MSLNKVGWACALAILVATTLQGCEEKTLENQQVSQTLETPITIKHELGTTVIDKRPQRVAALDMNEVDFLDQLGIPIAGMVKDYVPHYLTQYKNDPNVQDLGAIVQPNMERVHTLKPDLILMTPLHNAIYKELAEIAPTLHFDVNFRNSQSQHVVTVENHLLTLGKIFDKEELAQKKVAQLESKINEVRNITKDRSEKALIVLHNNGAFRNFGQQSRYGFIFNDFGVKPANTMTETTLHGQPISSEFIQQADPDIIYIVDRTAVMERRSVINSDDVSNPLLRQTKAWKNGRVIFVDADAWYIAAASPTSIKIMLDDVRKGYQSNF
ncbi:siderophore ABC transporter substrate-binding protein [Marinomonas transparens]|uniref:Siderophore ABC transporter substrate-binding protein n=1 Tax=Marinomonas transparens TaxID=2795388 RepID=A0A934JRG3_9GAMM|nr:siderophore ABC transporter substrate-binding protein [Marinomonas transparens]MBJ7539338.1 siderophore ABC transporter substrate-binding protein [Marinomonas transparens]